jgi:hypothetical protein
MYKFSQNLSPFILYSFLHFLFISAKKENEKVSVSTIVKHLLTKLMLFIRVFVCFSRILFRLQFAVGRPERDGEWKSRCMYQSGHFSNQSSRRNGGYFALYGTSV